jgi:ATP-dependent helicase/nuclease subunit A
VWSPGWNYLGARSVEDALVNAITDEQGQRILSDAHPEVANEFPVTAVLDGRVRQMVIDRTYVDAEGVRWIIDYKTGSHAGGDREGFFVGEIERYSKQLRGYRDAMQLLEPERSIRTALYFPLMKEFREVELD